MTGIAIITPGNVRVGSASQAVDVTPAENSKESLRLPLSMFEVMSIIK